MEINAWCVDGFDGVDGRRTECINFKDRLSGLHKSTISFCSFMAISVAFLIFALMFWFR